MENLDGLGAAVGLRAPRPQPQGQRGTPDGARPLLPPHTQPSTGLRNSRLRPPDRRGRCPARMRPAFPGAAGSDMSPTSHVQVPRHWALNGPHSQAQGPSPCMHTGSAAAHPLPTPRPPPRPALAPRTPLAVTTGPAGMRCLGNTSIRQKSPRVTRRKVHNRTVARL